MTRGLESCIPAPSLKAAATGGGRRAGVRRRWQETGYVFYPEAIFIWFCLIKPEFGYSLTGPNSKEKFGLFGLPKEAFDGR